MTEQRESRRPTEHVIIIGRPSNFMNGFGKEVEDPPGSSNFVFKPNKAPVTLAELRLGAMGY